MVRAVLLALVLALGGGAPHFGSLLDLVSAFWTADQVDAGNLVDPDGAAATGDAGGHFDPNG
jgi:hypothetical protein